MGRLGQTTTEEAWIFNIVLREQKDYTVLSGFVLRERKVKLAA